MKRILAIVTGVVLAIGGSEQTRAATLLYWDADGDASTVTGGTGNWDASGLTWRIGSSTGTLTNWIDGSAARFGGTGGTVTLTADVSVDGTNGQSEGGGGVGGGIYFKTSGYTLAGSKTLTIEDDGADRPFYANNTVTINAPLYLARNGTVWLEGTSVTVNGNISGAGAGTSLAGWSGKLTLSGNNTFAGGVGGYNYSLAIDSNTALGPGNFAWQNISSVETGPGNVTTANAISFGNDYNTTFAGPNSLTFSSGQVYYSDGFDVNSSSRITVSDPAGKLTFASLQEYVWYNAGWFTKLGSGTLVISGRYGSGGVTTVSAGTLIINGPTGDVQNGGGYNGQQNWTVASGAKLGGNGTINLASGKSVTVDAGGTLAPGNSPGILTISGDVNLNGTYQVDVGPYSVPNSPATFDQTLLTGTGALSLGATSALQALNWQNTWADWTTGTWYPILKYTSLAGTFGSLSGVYAVNYNFSSVDYPGQWIAIEVPEPATLALLGLGAAGLLARRRRR